MDAVVTTLRTVSLFAELPREVLARLVSELDELEVAPGQTVFSGHRLNGGARDRLVQSLGTLYAQRGRPAGGLAERSRSRGRPGATHAGGARARLRGTLGDGRAAGLVLAVAVTALVLWVPPSGL